MLFMDACNQASYIFLLYEEDKCYMYGCAGLNKRRSLNAYINRLPARRIQYEPFIFLYPAGNREMDTACGKQ